ncbi:MAG: isoprenyl transferase [Clostridia bacterium]
MEDTSKNPLELPAHIAIIMDGNGRWAKNRNLPRSAGHRAGCKVIQDIVEKCDRIGLRYLTVYAFSTENWTRPKREIKNLMSLLREFLRDTENKLGKSNVRIRVIGSRMGLDQNIIDSINRTEEKSKDKTGLNFIIALNYGSREEICNAVKEIARKVSNKEMSVDDINQEVISNHLYTSGIPDPDIILRPSGEKRLSNFLLWQASYAELEYSDILWPDFKVEDLLRAVQEYNGRERRYGGI